MGGDDRPGKNAKRRMGLVVAMWQINLHFGGQKDSGRNDDFAYFRHGLIKRGT
jgi:hypothetical protein